MLIRGNHSYLALSSIAAYYFYFLSMMMGKDILSTLLGSLLAIPYLFNSIVYKNRINRALILLSITMIIGSLLNLLVSDNGIGGTLVIIGVFSLSLSIIEEPTLYLKHAKFTYSFFSLFFYFQIFVLEINPNTFYEGMSRNYLGLILVYITVFYLFLMYVNVGKISLLIPFNSLLLSILFVGRSSIGAILALCIFTLCFKIKNVKKRWKVLIILTITIVLYVTLPLMEQFYALSSFSKFGLDTPRYELWSAFFNKADLYTCIAGINTNSIPEISYYEGNVHNGYINILARTGIGFIFFISILIGSVFRYLYNGVWYLLLLLGIVSFRVIFDTGVFISEVGFIYYTILLYPFWLNLRCRLLLMNRVKTL